VERLKSFVRLNRAAVVTAAITVGLAWVAFPFLIGLNGVVGAVLAGLVIAAAFGIYRLLTGTDVAWHEQLAPGRLAFSAIAGLVVVGLAIQVIPFGWDRSNPPVTAEPNWDSPRTRGLVVRACFDCHSNEVDYPWYSKVAPMSWAVQLHVDRARSEVNYSEWDKPQDEADESAEAVIDGEMPPAYYTRFAHPEARLSDVQLQQLIAGLETTFASGDGDEGEEEEEEEEDDD
jgi:hypothetical protein